MRKHLKVATLSLAVFAGACGTSKERSAALPDDLQKDLAAASAPASDLASAPKSFEPTQVVSAMERTTAPTRVKAIVKTKRHTKPMRRPEPVSKPAEELAAADVAGTTEMAPAPTAKAPAPRTCRPSRSPSPRRLSRATSQRRRPRPLAVVPAPAESGRVGAAVASADWVASSAGSSVPW